jgi:hypothetical protein
VDAPSSSPREGGVSKDARAPLADVSTTPHEAGPGVADARVADVTITVAPCTGALPVMTVHDFGTGTEQSPDWSCYERDGGAGAMPDSGAPHRFVTLRTAKLVSALFTSDVTVDVFFGPSTLGTPALTRAFGADGGSTEFSVPAGVDSLALLSHELAGAILTIGEVHQYGLPVAPGGGDVEMFVMPLPSRALSVREALAGGQEDPAKAVIFSAVRDCAGRAVRGARFELIDGETNAPVATGTAPGDPVSAYARYAIPTSACTYTSDEQEGPTWLMVNAPVSVDGGVRRHTYRLRLSGRKSASDVEPVILGERELETFAGGTTYVRADR